MYQQLTDFFLRPVFSHHLTSAIVSTSDAYHLPDLSSTVHHSYSLHLEPLIEPELQMAPVIKTMVKQCACECFEVYRLEGKEMLSDSNNAFQINRS